MIFPSWSHKIVLNAAMISSASEGVEVEMAKGVLMEKKEDGNAVRAAPAVLVEGLQDGEVQEDFLPECWEH